MNKKIAITAIVALLATALFSSCTKLIEALEYDLDMQTTEVELVIPPTLDTIANVTGNQSGNYNIDSFIKDKTGGSLGMNNISSAKLKSCQLTILNSTSTNNFANFRSCNASFFTNSNTTPYSISIANNPDVNSSVLNLPVDNTADLKSYLNSNSFSYALSGRLRRRVTDSLHCKAKFTFSIHVKP
ncbi:MAG: hypothetical protein EBX41_01840 [Chitinophagia bacterium]|nr:hypothetical protein [Chitinophagia bacterium]